MKYTRKLLAIVCICFLSPAMLVKAQQIYGVPGSPAATQSINGQVLPALSPQFGGVINLNANQSKPWWPPRIVPPKGAPNILLIMTDDVGFAAPGTFGGVIPTPALDRIAGKGLFGCRATRSRPCRWLLDGRNNGD